jgi:hypothetical protein
MEENKTEILIKNWNYEKEVIELGRNEILNLSIEEIHGLLLDIPSLEKNNLIPVLVVTNDFIIRKIDKENIEFAYNYKLVNLGTRSITRTTIPLEIDLFFICTSDRKIFFLT